MIGASIFDVAAIASRRRELFPVTPEPMGCEPQPDRERTRIGGQRCGICPTPADEECGRNCEQERQAIGDGVTVTWSDGVVRPFWFPESFLKMYQAVLTDAGL